MKTNLLKISNYSAIILTGVVAFFAPLLFTTTLGDVLDLPKQLLLYFTIGLLILITVARYLAEGVKIRTDKVTLPLVLLVVAAFLSSYFGLSRLSSLMNGLPAFIALILFYILLVQNLPSASNRTHLVTILYAVIGSVTFLAVWRILNFFEIYLPLTSAVIRNRAFTPIGSGNSLAVLMTMVMPVVFALLLRSTAGIAASSAGWRTPRNDTLFKWLKVVTFSLSILLMGAALILTAPLFIIYLVGFAMIVVLAFTPSEALVKMKFVILSISLALLLMIVAFHVPFTANKNLLDKVASFPKETQLDIRTSWVVGVHTVRDFPFFGSGLATYLSDFSRYRPLYYNLTNFWNVRFGAAGNYVLQLLATMGIVGLLAFGFFTSRLIKLVRSEYINKESFVSDLGEKTLKVGVGASLLTYLLSLLFTVPNFPVNLIFFTLLALAVSLFSSSLRSISPSIPMEDGSASGADKRDALPYLIVGPAVLLAVAIFYLAGRYALADYTFRRGINFAVAQKPQESFNTLRAAIQTNPYKDNYHLSLASLAFSLADSIAVKGKEMTKDDQSSLLQLLDFSIKEAKNAVTIDPANPDNWYNLASLYRNIAGFIQNSGDWAVATYQQAILLDPVNPMLRMDLGGLFYLAGDYESATNYFREAVSLKNDLPNAHFNLAYAYRQKNLITAAYSEMLQASRLVPLDSADYKKAADDLETLKKLLPADVQAQLNAATAPATETGTEITPTPTPELNIATPSAKLAQPKPVEEKIQLPEASPSTQSLP